MGRIEESNAAYHRHLAQNDVPHRYVEFDGRHSWDSWAPMFVGSLCQNLQQTCPVPSPEGWDVVSHPQ